MQALRAGLERVPITPPLGIMMSGYAARTQGSQSLLDDLYATALVLDNGASRVALVTCDLIFIHPTSVARIREEVAQRTAIPASNVMICCSHTHSGPISYAGPTQDERARAYATALIYQIAGVVVAANAQLQPVTIGYGRGAAYIGVNRREQRPGGQVVLGVNPEGPTDPEVLVLRLDTAEGDPLAVVANYACHAVALSSSSYGISADWPGAMRWAVESVTGATCLFVQGACADINPRHGPSADYAHAQELGQSVAGGVIQGWTEAKPASQVVTLAAAQQTLALPLLGPKGPDGKPVRPPEQVVDDFKMSWETVSQLRESLFPWDIPVQEVGGVWQIAAELQLLRIGQAAVVGFSAEPFVEVGLAVKARSPLPYTMFAGYTNGCIGYLPTAAAYEVGGYEVRHAYVWYHLPAMVAPTSAQQVEDAAADLLEKL